MNEFHLASDGDAGKVRCGLEAGKVAVVADLLDPGAVLCAKCAEGMEHWTLHAHAPLHGAILVGGTSNATITFTSNTFIPPAKLPKPKDKKK